MSEIPRNVKAALDRFDAAAQRLGWEADWGAAGVEHAMREHEVSKAYLEAVVVHALSSKDEILKAIEDEIFAKGLPLGSNAYFKIRKIVSDALRHSQAPSPTQLPQEATVSEGEA